jgi:predicted GH43/DUF377 family glycosyl hydrolase
MIYNKNYACVILFLSFIVTTCKPVTDDRSVTKQDWILGPFYKKDSKNPILVPDSTLSFYCPIRKREVRWAARNVLNPAAVVKDNQVFLFFRAQDKQGTSRIGLAVSNDGINFKIKQNPVLFPDNDEMKIYEWSIFKENEPECGNCFDGTEDPRIVKTEDGSYIMTYTVYNGKTARLSTAISKDLLNWKKLGLVIKDKNMTDFWSKSGAVISEQSGNDVIAKKINGKYWMYFGDTDLFVATSEDLINWSILKSEETGKIISVLHPRPGYFDSRLVEPGPFALWRKEGIVLIYNASNSATFGDSTLAKFTYAAGQALFDGQNPVKLTDRTNEWFIKPDKPYEKIGEVNEVCFVEGLVFFQNKWFLYYGTADSNVAVAVGLF